MRNIVIISVIIISLGYMFVVLSNKYDSIKATNETIKKTQTNSK